MAKILKLKYKTPAPDSPVNESKRGKETPKDPDRSGPTGQGDPEGQTSFAYGARRERE